MTLLDPSLVETLLNMSESNTLDFKQAQYPFSGMSDDARHELVKDVVAFANAWKTSDAYIVIGAEDGRGQRANVHGIAEQLDDASVQQFVNSKVNVPVDFAYVPTMADGRPVAVLRIARVQRRPVFLTKRVGPLAENTVPIRRGSSTDFAKPDEVFRMGQADAATAEEPLLTLSLADVARRVSLPSSIKLEPLLLHSLPSSRGAALGVYRASMPLALDVHELVRIGQGLPRPEVIASYRKKAALFTPVGFSIRNIGPVLLRDVRIVATVPRVDGVTFLDRGPQLSPGDGISDLVNLSHSDTSVVVRDAEVELTARMGKIQPDDTIWSDPFWVGGEDAANLTLAVRVYADNLSPPVTGVFDIALAPRSIPYDEFLPGEENDE